MSDILARLFPLDDGDELLLAAIDAVNADLTAAESLWGDSAQAVQIVADMYSRANARLPRPYPEDD